MNQLRKSSRTPSQSFLQQQLTLCKRPFRIPASPSAILLKPRALRVWPSGVSRLSPTPRYVVAVSSGGIDASRPAAFRCESRRFFARPRCLRTAVCAASAAAERPCVVRRVRNNLVLAIASTTRRYSPDCRRTPRSVSATAIAGCMRSWTATASALNIVDGFPARVRRDRGRSISAGCRGGVCARAAAGEHRPAAGAGSPRGWRQNPCRLRRRALASADGTSAATAGSVACGVGSSPTWCGSMSPNRPQDRRGPASDADRSRFACLLTPGQKLMRSRHGQSRTSRVGT